MDNNRIRLLRALVSEEVLLPYVKLVLCTSMHSSSHYSENACNLSACRVTLNHRLLLILILILILILLIVTSHEIAAVRQIGFQNSPKHSNFFRTALRGRHRFSWCADNPNMCLDREKNPWGGSTCCFRQLCKDTMNDPNHCGTCGRVCGHGLMCCDGKCVDIQNDPHNCGSCFQQCPSQSQCSYSICDYAG